VAGLLAKSARLLGTAANRVAFLAAEVASPAEGALDPGVRTVSLVVANLAAVEAFSGETASFGLVRAFASEVAFLIAARNS
jgi:hypothetical protein